MNGCRSRLETRRNNESYAACVALGRWGKSLLYFGEPHSSMLAARPKSMGTVILMRRPPLWQFARASGQRRQAEYECSEG